MRIEYWARVRKRGDSYYVTIPKGEAYKLSKAAMVATAGSTSDIIGQEVKVEVSL